MNIVKPILKILAIIIILVILIVGGYVLYVVLGYERIEDNRELSVNDGGKNIAAELLEADTEYTMLTFNIGFGAYNHDFSFFMDAGYMENGTETVGEMSRAESKDSVIRATNTVIEQALTEEPDITLFQEVDVAADRSHNVNQAERIVDKFSANGNYFNWTYATNFHTSYLFYPPTKPIGAIKDSGLLTISNYKIESAVRKSYPVSDAFPTKFFDLDRCFSVNHLPVKTSGGERVLVLINTHMSAYDEGGTIRKAQMDMLAEFITEEYEKGNWVIVGGDFNHALGGSESMYLGHMKRPEWVQAFDDSMLPKGFSILIADNLKDVATDRDSSIPYEKGINYEVVLDGFIVSDNIEATAHNIDGDYEGSDHNPVKMKFTLK